MSKIQIPDDWMGEPIEGSMKKILSREARQEPQQPAQAIAPNLDGFEYVPSIGLYVSRQKDLHGNNWDQATQALHNKGDRMPTISEFTEFLKHLRGQNTDEAKAVLDEIYKVEGDWRAEWLDARFTPGFMHYHVFGNEGIEKRSQSHPGVLMEDKTPGIDLGEWIGDNEAGLPREGVKSGDLYYWHPRDGRVARFDADSCRAYLNCDRNPTNSNPSLGVRAVRRSRENFSGGNS